MTVFHPKIRHFKKTPLYTPNAYTPNSYTPKLPSPKLPSKNRSPSPPAPGLPPPLPPQKPETTNFPPPPPAQDRQNLSDDDALLAFLSQDKRADTPNYKKSSRSNSIQKPGVGGGTDYSTLPPPVCDLKENTSPQVSPGTRVSGISTYQQAKRHVVKPYQPPTQPTPKQQSIFSTQPTYTPKKISLVEPLKNEKLPVNFKNSSSATVRSKICGRLRNLVIFEVFGVKFSAKKSILWPKILLQKQSIFWPNHKFFERIVRNYLSHGLNFFLIR